VMRCAGLSVRAPDAIMIFYQTLISYSEWPNGSNLRTSASFRTGLNEITQGEDTKSLLFEFNDSQDAELRKGLESPVTEFVRTIFVDSIP
jgi:hypothetical protein